MPRAVMDGRASWAEAIGGSWRKSVEAIFETGRLIAEAKAALPHGEFGQMIESELPFGPSTARRLMMIAADPKLANPAHVHVLPPSWGTLYELTKLDEQTFERRMSEGTIRPDMQRRDVAVGGARAIMASREQGAQSLDFFPTPPWATRALVEVVLPHLGASLNGAIVHDPACGEGHMTGVLLEYDKIGRVIGTDIKDYGREGRAAPAFQGVADFLAPGAAVAADWIITNPPFGDQTLAFVLRALEVAGSGVAMFVRQQWLEGIERYQLLFKDRPPTLYAQFCERVNLCEGKWEPLGSTATAYCWLVWRKGQEPQPPFWIPPGQRKRFLYPDDVERFTAHPVFPPAHAVDPSAARYAQALDALADRKGRLVMAEAATALRLGREAGVSPYVIAQDLGHPVGTIKTWLNRLGLTDINRMHEVNAQRAAEWSGT